MTSPSEDAYERIQKMLGEKRVEKVIIDNHLTKEERKILAKSIINKLVRHTTTTEHTAGLVADSVIDLIDQFIDMKHSAAHEPPEETDEDIEQVNNTKFVGFFRRSE